MLQIEAFVLYHATIAEPRVLRLKPGLNVLTGWRNTGKSSLIEIVDYCFGRKTLHVSEGKVRDHVAWYALILRNNDKYVFVARPAPAVGSAGSTEGMFTPLNSPEPLERESLRNNCLVNQLRSEISAFAGFADTQFVPPDGARRPSLDLHIGHALPITMQDEEDIYSKNRLFHRGDERDVMQALRDTFPYLVGAADANAPVLRGRLTALRTELRQIDRELTKLESASQELDERGLTLLVLASEVGLAQGLDLSEPPAPRDILAALRSAVAQDPEAPSAYAPTGEAERLLEQRRQLGVQLRAAERDQALLRDFGHDRDAFSLETNEQRARLATIGLIADGDDHDRCPVCDSILDEPDPEAAQLVDHLRNLELDLDGVSQMEPRTRAALENAAASVESLTGQIRAVTSALADLDQQERSTRKAATLAARRARTQGLIEEYLRVTPQDSAASRTKLEERRTVIKSAVEELEAQVDTELEQERLEGALDLIGADMTGLARKLTLEHSEHGQVGLRLTQTPTLTITTAAGRTFPLRGIGGGGTRVGYHLAAHLAIHRLLRIRDRPTPAFLLLDQPTGPFYPDIVPVGEEPQLERESDQAAVDAIFALIQSVADDLDGALQILVTDHAKFYGEDWFDLALVEDWRHGQGLIPDDWLQ
jgi:hypothetical protein